MSDTTTARSSAYSATTIPSEWNAVPSVQYGFPEDKGPIRAPKLKTIFDPIPEGANTASPLYLLTPEEFERQDEFESGYDVSGTSSIGKELQDRCENDDRVFYPIHIESDVYHDEDAQTLIEWFREFTDGWLNVPFQTVPAISRGIALSTSTSHASYTERNNENASRSKQRRFARSQARSWTLASTTRSGCSGSPA